MMGRLYKFLISLTLGFVFYLVLTPVGFIFRLLGRDPLKLNPRVTTSYWIEKKSSDEAETNQFNRQY